MSQTTSGIRALLSIPVAYETFQRAIGSTAYRHVVIDELVRPSPGSRVLDVGCGPGDLLSLLPSTCTYVGFDVSESYITSAQRRYGDRGHFFIGGVEDAADRAHTMPAFDRVIATGVLHHLDDDTARRLWQFAAACLAPGGRVVTVDPCFHSQQHPLAHWLAARDRGQAVRRPEQYAEMARSVFDDVVIEVRTDMLRIPYSHATLVAQRPRNVSRTTP